MRNPAITLLFSCALLSGGLAAPAMAHETEMAASPSPILEAAVAAPERPEAARKLDENRKPAATLAFLGLAPGMDAADLIPGDGYWTEIMAHVVGPDGSVTALQPEQFGGSEQSKSTWADLLGRTEGTKLELYPFDQFTYTRGSFDFAIMNLNYHDLYWESEQFKIPETDPDLFLKGLYAAMRPGSVVGIIDYVGLPGDTRETVDKLHRIDPAVVKADFERAGFVLEAESDLLTNPDDDHTASVFDPSIRGQTDRFLLRFRKPA